MTLDPKVIGELVIAAALIAINLPPIIAWLRAKMPDKPAPVAPDPNAKTGDERSPGDVLDCLNADMAYFKSKTDCPPEKLKAIEDLTPYLTHIKAGA